MMKKQYLLSCIAMLLLAGCNANENNNPPAPGGGGGNSATLKTATIDASDYNTPAYFDFETGTTVGVNDDWDIAFKRYNISVNENKRTAIADKQDEYYPGGNPDAQTFTNSSDATELSSLSNATAILDSWIDSGLVTAIDNSWYSYDVVTHQLSPTGQYFILKSAEGNSYAKMHVSAISPAYLADFQFNVQASGQTAFAASSTTWQISVNTAGDTCYDFDSAAVVDCTTQSSIWDVQLSVVGFNITVKTNGGVSGVEDAAVYKLASGENESDYTRGDYAGPGSGGVFSAAYQQDKKGSAFNEYSWYAYDPVGAGDHKLWTNYRVYVVDTDVANTADQPYKMQILSYYNSSTAASGHFTIRYLLLDESAE